MDWRATGLLGAVSLIWGAAFPVTKIAVSGGMPPLTLATERVFIAAAVLMALAAWTKQIAELLSWRLLRRLGLVALSGYAVPYCLMSWAEQRITSGETTILLAAIPLLTTLFASCIDIPHRQSSTLRVAATLLPGLCGVAILIGTGHSALWHAHISSQADTIEGYLAALGAAASFSVALVCMSRLPPAPPLALGGITLTLATVILLPMAAAIDHTWMAGGASPSVSAILAVVFLGICCTALTSILYFTLIAMASAAFASLNNYLVPVISLLLGSILISEPVTIAQLASISLVLLSIFLAGSDTFRKPVKRPAAALPKRSHSEPQPRMRRVVATGRQHPSA